MRLSALMGAFDTLKVIEVFPDGPSSPKGYPILGNRSTHENSGNRQLPKPEHDSITIWYNFQESWIRAAVSVDRLVAWNVPSSCKLGASSYLDLRLCRGCLFFLCPMYFDFRCHPESEYSGLVARGSRE